VPEVQQQSTAAGPLFGDTQSAPVLLRRAQRPLVTTSPVVRDKEARTPENAARLSPAEWSTTCRERSLRLRSRGQRRSPYGSSTGSSNHATRLVVIAGHDHMDTFTHNPTQYMAALLSFIEGQLGPPPGAAGERQGDVFSRS
jgi:hypothetical protein